MMRRLLAGLVLWGFPVLGLSIVGLTIWLFFVSEAEPAWWVFLLIPLSVGILAGFVAALRPKPTPPEPVTLPRGSIHSCGGSSTPSQLGWGYLPPTS